MTIVVFVTRSKQEDADAQVVDVIVIFQAKTVDSAFVVIGGGSGATKSVGKRDR